MAMNQRKTPMEKNKRAVRERRKEDREEGTKSILIKGIPLELLDAWKASLEENGLKYKEGFIALLHDHYAIPLQLTQSANERYLVRMLQQRGILKKKEQIQVLIGAINFIIQQ